MQRVSALIGVLALLASACGDSEVPVVAGEEDVEVVGLQPLLKPLYPTPEDGLLPALSRPLDV